ncbi:ribonuclease domain-containing protein [Pectobacterium versatile]|uniref:ribonuclease domain-containing protein n=1 Tax=Pectobacterium versatile TaxID=2488639 RepID=UPI0038283E39
MSLFERPVTINLIDSSSTMMKSKRAAWVCCLIAASALLSSNTYAAKIPDCGKNSPSKTLPTPQNSEYDAYRNAKISAVDKNAKNKEFNNNEKILPAAGKNEVYYEYYLGYDGNNGAGSHRAVLLVSTPAGKNKVLQSYYTQDHYKTFCALP